MKQPDWIEHASETVRNSNPHIFGGKARKTRSRVSVGSGKGNVMNKTEAEFAFILEAQKLAGEIRDYLFHPLRLPWGMNDGEAMRYTPDFMVTPNSGIEKRRLIEIKGPHIHYEQQAIARFKGARAYWPEFEFEMWQLKKGQGWVRKF